MCGQTVLKLTGSLHARDKGNGRCHGLLDVNLREIRPSNLLLICLACILHNSGLPGEEVSLELQRPDGCLHAWLVEVLPWKLGEESTFGARSVCADAGNTQAEKMQQAESAEIANI